MKQNKSDIFTKADGNKLKKELISAIDFKIVEKLNEIRDEMKEQYSNIFGVANVA